MAILASVWWGGGELEIEDSLEGVLTPIEQGCSAFVTSLWLARLSLWGKNVSRKGSTVESTANLSFFGGIAEGLSAGLSWTKIVGGNFRRFSTSGRPMNRLGETTFSERSAMSGLRSWFLRFLGKEQQRTGPSNLLS
ncbi:hypothetical protein M407DRAFT_12799 [Tulasnella calospora MUT 4182]|uniref:Uncharacterized protein n=1 Tax=Tulasnella calospora MUT 4182 TaxID=1051891 RepID=A0A0C3L4D5_9AGAM|nr:hypothetical protein M407DRAFT_12799 [Tulasnella calospora MUT 4182]